MTLCTKCSHPLNSHSPDTGRCNVAGGEAYHHPRGFAEHLVDRNDSTSPAFCNTCLQLAPLASLVCDCGQPVVVEGEEVLGYIGFSSFRDDVA